MSDLTPDSKPATPTAPATPEGSPAPASRRGLTIAIALGLAVFLLGVWLVIAELPQLLTGPRNGPPVETAPPTIQAGTRRIHVNLFYVSESGLELVAVGRDLPYAATPSEQARRIVEAQVHLAPEGQVSAIPPETSVRAVYLAANGEAYVDLGPEILANQTGGALDEALAVYAIVNAMTINLPNVITSVQILIDGKEVDTLAGHVDLRRPLRESLEWVQNATPTTPKGK